MKHYEKLFVPWYLKKICIKNHIGIPPLVIGEWGDDTGQVTERHIEHYRALAGGGAGLVIQEATSISREGRLALTQLGIWEDGQINGLRCISEEFHHARLPAVLQLSHAGLRGIEKEYWVAPSEYRYMENGVEHVGKQLTIDEIHRIEQEFIVGAERACMAGYDGIELHCCRGYLLSEFLNCRINKRTDEYQVKDRLILKHIIEGIRKCTPPDFIIGCRLGAFEPDLKEGISNAKWLETQGIDFIDVFYGSSWEEHLEKAENYPFTESVYGAKCLKQAVSVPVFATGQISTGEQAEAVLQDTKVDMAMVGRSSLVNPYWANDIKIGRNPGRCLGCSVCMWEVNPEKCPGKIQLTRKRNVKSIEGR